MNRQPALRRMPRGNRYLVILLLSSLGSLEPVTGWVVRPSKTNPSATKTFSSSAKEATFVDKFQSTFPSFYYGSLLDPDEDLPSTLPIQHRFRVPNTPPHSHPHLFRHYDDISFDSWLRCANPEDFWESVGYKLSDLPQDLLEAPVHEMIAPHVRFLVEVLKGGSGRLAWSTDDPTFQQSEECEVEEEEHHTMTVFPETQKLIPHSFYRCSIERTVGPWHAYLEHHDLPHGHNLLQDTTKLAEFFSVCESGKVDKFADLCQEWSNGMSTHNKAGIMAFSRSFRRGLLPAVKNALSDDLDAVDCSPSRMVDILISNGANFLQKDKQGVDLLHWAAGTHHWSAVQSLLQALTNERYPYELYPEKENCEAQILLESASSKDGATPLHWAACGFGRQRIGCGGSLEVCAGLLQHAGDQTKELACAKSWYGATPLMFAAWAGSLDVILLLLNAGADPRSVNNKQQNAAHYAAAAGHLSVCQNLYELLGDEFFSKDTDGKTPLDYAKLYDRGSVVEWLSSVRGM